MVEQRLHKVKMNGREVYKVAVRSLTDVVEALAANGFTAADVDHVVPHQANIRIVDTVLERLAIPQGAAILNIDRYGNTSSASVPVTLDEGVRSGRIQSGDLVCHDGHRRRHVLGRRAHPLVTRVPTAGAVG
jgi:3-oxoacyl-[acyl-carrier-protein] synthase-3